jgi:hypothetical protein
MRLSELPPTMAPGEIQDELWLRRNLGPMPKLRAPAPVPNPVAAARLDQVDDMLVRLMALTQRLYDLRQVLLAAGG